MTYRYAWGNNARRRELKGRHCEIVHVMKRQSVVLRFPDTGELVVSSRRAIRRTT